MTRFYPLSLNLKSSRSFRDIPRMNFNVEKISTARTKISFHRIEYMCRIFVTAANRLEHYNIIMVSATRLTDVTARFGRKFGAIDFGVHNNTTNSSVRYTPKAFPRVIRTHAHSLLRNYFYFFFCWRTTFSYLGNDCRARFGNVNISKRGRFHVPESSAGHRRKCVRGAWLGGQKGKGDREMGRGGRGEAKNTRGHAEQTSRVSARSFPRKPCSVRPRVECTSRPSGTASCFN